MKGRVLLDEKQDVVLTQNAILFVECLIRAKIGHQSDPDRCPHQGGKQLSFLISKNRHLTHILYEH